MDQCAEVGLEMVIQSFGSGVNMESGNERYLNRIRAAYDYGHQKGIRMGAYTLAYVKTTGPSGGMRRSTMMAAISAAVWPRIGRGSISKT